MSYKAKIFTREEFIDYCRNGGELSDLTQVTTN